MRDECGGVIRITYGLFKHGKILAIAIFVPAPPVDGMLCLNSAYAVDEFCRSRGLGSEIVWKALDELASGFRSAGVPGLYVEALVSPSNEPSRRLASKLYGGSAKSCTDEVSGLPALHYLLKLY